MNAEERLPNWDRPAFPFACQGPTTGPEFYYGLTKREYFAAMAMQGIIANWGFCSTPNEQIALRSTSLADALLAELEKTKPPAPATSESAE